MAKYWSEVFAVRTERSDVRINMTLADILPVRSRTGMVNNRLTTRLKMVRKMPRSQEKHRILQKGNSDRETTRLLLTSDVNGRRERELEGKEKKCFA